MPHRVGRWEAKRIAIVFDNCDPEAARDMLNAARKAFSRRKLQRVENETPIGEVTCSAGLVLAPNAVSEDLGSFAGGGEILRSHDCHPRRWPSLLLRWPRDQRSH
jgi:diguanylate cyclase